MTLPATPTPANQEEAQRPALRVQGVYRDKDSTNVLGLIFNRAPTDLEVRVTHDALYSTYPGYYGTERSEDEAAGRVRELLMRPVQTVADEGYPPEGFFDPWDLFPSVFGCYNSQFDAVALGVLRDMRDGTTVMRGNLAAEFFKEMLCRAHLCDYGVSPRGASPTLQFRGLLPTLIRAWEGYYQYTWGEVAV